MNETYLKTPTEEIVRQKWPELMDVTIRLLASNDSRDVNKRLTTQRAIAGYATLQSLVEGLLEMKPEDLRALADYHGIAWIDTEPALQKH